AFIRSGAIYTWSQNGEKRITQENNYRFLSYDKKNHRLLFSKFIKSEEADLGFYDLTTKREGMLLSKPNQQIHAMASGDGNLIYFVDAYLFNSAVVQNIFSYHNRTHAVKPVVNEKKGVFFRPAPSPDGKKLAYISNDNRGRNLYIKDLRSGRVTRIATRENYVDFPCWDNGGQKILANALIGNSLQLVIYDLNAKTNQILDIKGECTEGCW
ncbi:MAG TPA: hypothetical protein VHY08_02985, partial [Bacillota bacterium]|nr:hypothetical protein [Bacillota bacterium]